MRRPIIVPEVGPGSEPLRLGRWLIDEGDFVLRGDLVAEVLIPGVLFEISSEATGQFVEMCATIDTVVAVGQAIGWLDDGATESASSG